MSNLPAPAVTAPLHAGKLAAALTHAKAGFAVFPLVPNAKVPPKGFFKPFERATTNREQIEAWWAQYPNANIGIPTEPYLVVDIDPRNGGHITAQMLAMTEEDLPSTLCSHTAGGGSHMLYKLPDHVVVHGGSNKLGGPGIDIKSWGGFIVAPGSVINGVAYEWRIPKDCVDPLPMAPAPQWLIERCKAAKPKGKNAGKRLVEEDEDSIKLSLRYIESGAPFVEQGRRGSTAYEVACRFYEYAVYRDTCVDLLTAWSESHCSPPMDEGDITHAADSADKNMQNAKGCRHPLAPGFEAVMIAPRAEVGNPAAEKPPTQIVASKEDYDKTFRYLITKAPMVEGSARENAARDLATKLVAMCSPAQTKMLMDVWNQAACEPELNDSFLQSAIDKAKSVRAELVREAPAKMPTSIASAIPFKEPWGEPVDLWPSAMAPADLPFDAVPDLVARFAEDRGRRLGIAPGAAAAALITSLGSLVPAGNELQMRQLDPHWTVRSILWTAIIGEPGSNKSAALSAAVSPLKAIEKKWQLRHIAETRRAELTKASTGANKTKAAYRQKIVNDATTEALAPLLAENPAGLLCYVDELAGLFGGMDAYRQRGGKDRPFWLQAKEGGAFTINRKTSDRIAVKNCAISILGSIQPEKLQKLAAGLSDDGFLQRFSLVYIQRDGGIQDIPPDVELDAALIRVASDLVDAADGTRFRFSPEADVELRDIEAFKFHELAKPNTSSFVRQWLDKLPNEFGRVALAFHHIEHHTSEAASIFEDPAPALISVATARRARRYLTDFIYSHVQAFSRQSPQSSAGSEHAIWIAGFILAGERGKVDARDIYRSYHAISQDEIARVMVSLELLDWVCPIKVNAKSVATGWAVNPAVHDGRFKAIAEAESHRRADVRQKVAQGRPKDAESATAMVPV